MIKSIEAKQRKQKKEFLDELIQDREDIIKVCRENGWDGNGKVSQFIEAEIKGYRDYRLRHHTLR